MKVKLVIFSSLLLAAINVGAAPTLTTGTPGNSYLATPVSVSPSFGTLFNFDGFAPNTTYNPATYAAQGLSISSPDPLVVLPYSTQSAPNFLYDGTTVGTANIQLTTGASSRIGVGISDSDAVSITLQPLTQSGTAFGSAFSVSLPTSGPNPFNGYFIISDTTADIYGLRIVQSVGSTSFSGLAIDDVQVSAVATPEPASFALLGAGALLLGFTRLRKRA